MLAFLGLTLVVLIATLGLARWSFERGFLDYVNALEQTRLERVSINLGRLYLANNQDWDSIDRETLNQTLVPLDGPRKRPRKRPPPPPFGRLDDDRGPPPDAIRPEQLTTSLPSESLPDAPPPRGERGPMPQQLPGHLIPPTALFNMQGERIVGRVFKNADIDIIEVPVVVDGQTVALVKSEPRRNLSTPVETVFSRQQWLTSLVIGVASLLLAALVSWWLTRLLLAPVRRIIRGIRQLSAGDYSQQLSGGNDEFGRLMKDINHLSNTLDKNQSSRRRWLADISHELRTPLAILTGEIEALKDGIRPFDKTQLESLDQEVVRLRHLTDDLYQLSISDIGGLRYEFVSLDLGECIQEVVTANLTDAEKQDINLSFEQRQPLTINADQQRICQLISNLIRNSLAYTNSGGVITVNLNRQADEAVLKIHDTPPGVTQQECDQLFEPLYRQDSSRNRRSAGAGLGLAICRNIVEAHRGTISAAPSPLGGLEITVTLPILEEAL